MAQQAQTQGAESEAGATAKQAHAVHHRLGPFLCWAVVFADIGTSVYYTPGILFGYPGIGRLAGFFVLLTLVAFLLLSLKYAEVSARFPEGGGVVTVATHGLNPWAGALGGMFILVDYFLTSAISSLSGLLYFQAIFPQLGAAVVLHLGPLVYPIALTLLITLVVLVLLGILNWYGIRESAAVSAVIAVAAFVSDMVIIALILIRVPPATIGHVFAAMFTGRTLTPLVILTGFAGAFLAFSGLESISQLSPVMRLPRKKTVSAALAIVVITVGVTSPLLTIFSTVLLTDPQFSGVLAVPRYAQYNMAPGAFDPNQFISLLAGAYGGRIIEVATAVVASCLLIFASNTAIIGAYHVFLALARMKFFPAIVEKQNKMRGTPHVSILLATVIPIAVLIAVDGNVNTLGDLYAFGLLGAFSLTCIAMDIIRFRERHGGEHVGAEIDPELLAAAGQGLGTEPPTAPGPSLLARLWRAAVSARLRSRIGEGTAQVRAQVGPLLARLRGRSAEPLADITYYVGFVTTALVLVAWVTNLYFKPHATIFGGGITALGVAIAAAHYQYLKRHGEPAVFLNVPSPTPDSWLVVLSPISNNSKTVVQTVIRRAHGRPLVFLYLAPQSLMEEPPRLFEITDRFGEDRNAQRVLSFAKKEAMSHQINARYLYAIGGAQQVFDIARRVRPDEIVAEEHIAKRISHAAPSEAGMAVSPRYVRYQHADGVTIAHNVLHELYTRPSGPGTAVGGLHAGPPTRSSPAAKPPQSSGSDGSASGPTGGATNTSRQRPPGGDGNATSSGSDPPRGEPLTTEDLGDE